jgi:uroporphyrinogen decarboxylase
MTTKNCIYINAARQKNTSGKPPIWMMRQAGRYLPQYRKVREKHTFLEMVKNPEVATEVTLQPIDIFGFDAAILFCDILVTAEAMGCGLQFIEKKGPVFDKPIQTQNDILALSTENIPEKLAYVADAIQLIQKELTPRNIPLIGFAGAPFTVASYMIEGQSSPDLKNLKKLMYSNPHLFHELLQKLTTVTLIYLKEQIKAGVDAIQVFDTWASHLSFSDYVTFSLPYIRQIIEGLPAEVPKTVFCKNSAAFAPLLAQLPVQAVSLDWGCSLSTMRKTLGHNITLQGNLDPYALFASPEILTQSVQRILQEMNQDPGFIFNLGHGLMPDINPDQVKRVVDLVHSWEGYVNH